MKEILTTFLFLFLLTACEDTFKEKEDEPQTKEWQPLSNYTYYKITNKTDSTITLFRKYANFEFQRKFFKIKPNSYLLDSISSEYENYENTALHYLTYDLDPYRDSDNPFHQYPIFKFDVTHEEGTKETSYNNYYAIFSIVGGRVFETSIVYISSEE